MSLISSTTAPETAVVYPSSDGEPMAETEIHVLAIIQLLELLKCFFAEQTDVYIVADMFWYWEEGDPGARRAPDIMLIKGVGRAPRRSFFSWRENGAVPCFIVEFASQNNWREDLYEKRRLYARLGVREYFIFDPEALYLRPPLQGFRLTAQGIYVPLEADADDRLQSEELGLYLRGEGTMLRLIDAATGQRISTRQEQVERLEAEVVRLRALLEEADQKPV